MSTVDKIMRYEDGEMEEDEVIEFFQELVDSGLAWKLQGHYGRMADHLLREGFISYGQRGKQKPKTRP